MKRLRLFPKTFIYTLGLLLFIIVIAHILLYFLAPKMQIEFSSKESAANRITIEIREEKIVMETVKKALPYSFIGCFAVSAVCSFFYARAIAKPVEQISAVTQQMMQYDKAAACPIYAEDEIGILAQNINQLYLNVLSTIAHLEEEKNHVNEAERAKADFLRAASHELKTPVTALSAILENMILEVGKYQDHERYLPECKELTDALSKMIQEILETSKLDSILEHNNLSEIHMPKLLMELCEPYQLITAAHQISFTLDLQESTYESLKNFFMVLPADPFRKAVSNILANAVAYTDADKRVFVSLREHSLVVENECTPIPDEEIPRLFEPFYRREFSRSQESGGNGLGLYIVDKILKSMHISYSFTAMENLKGMRFTINLY